MTDISPELLEKIQKTFEEETVKLREQIKAGVKNYDEAYSYARKVGEALSRSFGVNITSEILPDGKLYYNIADKVVRPMLEAEYELSSAAAVSAQKSANKAAGIGIKPQTAEFNEDKAQGIIDRVSSQPFDEVKWLLNEPVKTFSQNVVDDTIQKNVEFQGKSGLSPKIVRKPSPDACEWCRTVAGTYTYPDVPKDVYRRHENCNCVVEYVEGGKYKNVWTKRNRSTTEESQQRKLVGLGENEQNYKPVVIDKKNQKKINRDVTIKLSKLENEDYEIYVSNKTILKPKEQQAIVQSINRSLGLIDTSGNKDLPMFAILDDSEIADNVLASYNFVENCIYLRRTVGNKNKIKNIQIKNGLACPKDSDSTMLHEIIHWKDASDYRQKHGAITEENKDGYKEFLKVESKNKLDKLGIDNDNVGRISKYAKVQYIMGKFDETFTEFRVVDALR
jgi:hypothetical protein